MTKTKLFSLVMIPLIIFLGWSLINGIKSKIDLTKAIEGSEKQVIAKLKMIRKAEKEYLSIKGRYTSNWDSLVKFIQEDSIYTIEKKEIITPWSERDRKDPKYFQRIDSVRIEYDTLGATQAKEFLFPAEEYPNFDATRISYIPGTEDKQFEIFADKIDKRGVTIDVIEVVDKFPLDKTRNDDNVSPTRWYLRFGSRTEVTTSGNWE